jgi:hypothetical protein
MWFALRNAVHGNMPTRYRRYRMKIVIVNMAGFTHNRDRQAMLLKTKELPDPLVCEVLLILPFPDNQ